MRIGILTVSNRGARGKHPDSSGPLIAATLAETLPEYQIARTTIAPDERDEISARLIAWSDDDKVDVIFTTAGLEHKPHAMLTRGVCGRHGRTLIVNLPGSPGAVRENLAVIQPVLRHAVALLREAPGAETGHTSAHGPQAGR